jgi:hypothetical protein
VEDCGLWIVDCGLRNVPRGTFRIVDCGLRNVPRGTFQMRFLSFRRKLLHRLVMRTHEAVQKFPTE